jgi:hypothetical protein
MPRLYRGEPGLTTLIWYHFNQIESNRGVGRGGKKKKTKKNKKRRRSTKKR